MQHHTSEESFYRQSQRWFPRKATPNSRNSRNRKIPRHQGRRNTDWLLHRKYSPARLRRRRHGPPNPLRFTGKPPRETQAVIQLRPRFSQRLARLVRQDVRQILFGFADQIVPFQHLLGADPWVEFPVFLKCGVGGLDGRVDVLEAVVWARSPNFAGAGICLCGRIISGLFPALDI